MEFIKNFTGQFHRHIGHGHAAALDVRFRADLLGYIERLLKGLVQSPACSLMRERELISCLELTEDFRLAQHHRIQSAGHLEEMLHRRFAGVLIENLIRIRFHLAVL